MRKATLTLLLSGMLASSFAAVTPPVGAVDPVTSTAESPVWYAMMSSHLTTQDRMNRWLYYDGNKAMTEQHSDGIDGVANLTDYAWRLEDNGDGTVRFVHYSGMEIFVPASARAEDGSDQKNTPLLMQADGSSWEMMLSSATGLSNDCADHQWCFDFTGYSESGRAFLNTLDGNSGGEFAYGLTIYSAGVHQASGWFFVPVSITEEPDPEPGTDPDEPITGGDGYIVDDPFETMVRLGRMTPRSPIYAMPSGSNGSTFVTSAITSGDAVDYPLGYTATSNPSKYFVVVSRQTTLVMRDASFDLVLTTKSAPKESGITVWTDWDRNGTYEKATGKLTVDASSRSITQQFTVPADAALGKTRVRVRLEDNAATSADAAMGSGKIYDFVIYVLEGEERDDCYVSVSSSDTRWGNAYVETTPNEDGRYDKGTDVTVRAVINEEAGKEVIFDGWTLGGETVSEELTYTFTVNESVHLTAMFSVAAPTPPTVSTEDAPVWYQIMNAHTDPNRADRYLAYDTQTDDAYSTPLRAEKPADTSDKFLWRLEDAGDGMVRIINRASGLAIHGVNVLESTPLDCTEEGSSFVIENSGAENESWSILFEGKADRLLNAQDGSWKIVLYNAGIGTGSGWYFTEVQVEEPDPGPGSGIYSTADGAQATATLDNGTLCLAGLPVPCTVRAYNLSGQLLAAIDTASTETSIRTGRTETFVLAVITPAGSGEATVLKCMDASAD